MYRIVRDVERKYDDDDDDYADVPKQKHNGLSDSNNTEKSELTFIACVGRRSGHKLSLH